MKLLAIGPTAKNILADMLSIAPDLQLNSVVWSRSDGAHQLSQVKRVNNLFELVNYLGREEVLHLVYKPDYLDLSTDESFISVIKAIKKRSGLVFVHLIWPFWAEGDSLIKAAEEHSKAFCQIKVDGLMHYRLPINKKISSLKQAYKTLADQIWQPISAIENLVNMPDHVNMPVRLDNADLKNFATDFGIDDIITAEFSDHNIADFFSNPIDFFNKLKPLSEWKNCLVQIVVGKNSLIQHPLFAKTLGWGLSNEPRFSVGKDNSFEQGFRVTLVISYGQQRFSAIESGKSQSSPDNNLAEMPFWEVVPQKIKLNEKDTEYLNRFFMLGVKVDAAYFFKLLQGSISLDYSEKQRVIIKLKKLRLISIKKLISTFEEEEKKMWQFSHTSPLQMAERISKTKQDWTSLKIEFNLPDIPWPCWFGDIVKD
ncbi:hypothetical protein [Thiomicrospira sp. ALE5]|uniref:hypothetical protein n=1 Tax=Thiomicrospira sp. ALE5 TaxID=748650 RepID=UPI0008ED5217|nr:hypothetical protein [Thiomicrospira sp. ALE5]SFR52896.1 hypothetical protein SAMN03092900_0770 [Thiomicrospira sp. ALE5]